jgi:hypothetical protein
MCASFTLHEACLRCRGHHTSFHRARNGEQVLVELLAGEEGFEVADAATATRPRVAAGG